MKTPNNRHFQVIVSCVLFFIVALFILAQFQCCTMAYLDIKTNYFVFHTTEAGFPLYDGITASRIQTSGLALYAAPASITLESGKTHNKLLKVPTRVMVKSADPIMLSADGKRMLGLVSMQIADSYDTKIDWQENALTIDFSLQNIGATVPRIEIETGGRFTITGTRCTLVDEYGQVIREVDSQEGLVFYLKDSTSIKLSTAPASADFMVKCFFAETENPFAFMQRIPATHLGFYEQPVQIAAYNSKLKGGSAELVAPCISFRMNHFIVKEQTFDEKVFLKLDPEAEYSIDRMVCAKDSLNLSLSSRRPGSLKIGKHPEIIENIIPTVLDYLIKEPLIKQILVAATGAVAFIITIIQLRKDLSEKEKALPEESVARKVFPPETKGSSLPAAGKKTKTEKKRKKT